MTIVQGKLIGAGTPARVEMRATLVDVTGKPAVGYVASVPGEVVKAVPIQAEDDGDWQVTLTGNAGITSDAGDTLWAIQEGRALDGTPILTYVLVPETGGPYWAGNIRADLSDTISGVGTVVYLPGPEGPPGAPGVGGVASVNGQLPDGSGAVTVTAGHVGADPAGSADAAETAAAADATGKVQAHTGSADPHGDRAWAVPQFTDHGSRIVAVETGFSVVNGYITDALNRVAALEVQMTAEQARPALWTVDGPPAGALGRGGDYALDAGARRLYGPRETGGWETWLQIAPPTEAGWQFNGFAVLDGSDLYLTHAVDGFGSGTCWNTTGQATDGLDVTFEVEMSGGSGADGVCFALADPADTPATFQGGGGGDLGLVGCTSVALALDTGGGSRARIVTTDADSMDAVATYGGALALRAAPVLVRVLYAVGAMSVWADGVLLFDEVVVAAPATARVGWTGSNGGSTDDHIVRSVAFVPRGGIAL